MRVSASAVGSLLVFAGSRGEAGAGVSAIIVPAPSFLDLPFDAQTEILRQPVLSARDLALFSMASRTARALVADSPAIQHLARTREAARTGADWEFRGAWTAASASPVGGLPGASASAAARVARVGDESAVLWEMKPAVAGEFRLFLKGPRKVGLPAGVEGSSSAAFFPAEGQLLKSFAQETTPNQAEAGELGAVHEAEVPEQRQDEPSSAWERLRAAVDRASQGTRTSKSSEQNDSEQNNSEQVVPDSDFCPGPALRSYTVPAARTVFDSSEADMRSATDVRFQSGTTRRTTSFDSRFLEESWSRVPFEIAEVIAVCSRPERRRQLVAEALRGTATAPTGGHSPVSSRIYATVSSISAAASTEAGVNSSAHRARRERDLFHILETLGGDGGEDLLRASLGKIADGLRDVSSTFDPAKNGGVPGTVENAMWGVPGTTGLATNLWPRLRSHFAGWRWSLRGGETAVVAGAASAGRKSSCEEARKQSSSYDSFFLYDSSKGEKLTGATWILMKAALTRVVADLLYRDARLAPAERRLLTAEAFDSTLFFKLFQAVVRAKVEEFQDPAKYKWVHGQLEHHVTGDFQAIHGRLKPRSCARENLLQGNLTWLHSPGHWLSGACTVPEAVEYVCGYMAVADEDSSPAEEEDSSPAEEDSAESVGLRSPAHSLEDVSADSSSEGEEAASRRRRRPRRAASISAEKAAKNGESKATKAGSSHPSSCERRAPQSSSKKKATCVYLVHLAKFQTDGSPLGVSYLRLDPTGLRISGYLAPRTSPFADTANLRVLGAVQAEATVLRGVLRGDRTSSP